MCCAWITTKLQQPFLYWGNVAEKQNSNFKKKFFRFSVSRSEGKKMLKSPDSYV
jgi:hypothetical protein